MGKWANDGMMDAALSYVATGVVITVCSAQPTNLTEATTTYSLAGTALTPGAGNGDFTLANGDSSGRKLTISQQVDVTVDTDGTATHIAICSGSALLYVTTCVSQSVVTGNTVTLPAWDIEIADPS